MTTPIPYPPASIYHAHHADFTDDLKYWRSLADHYGSPVLELGCGTGRVTTDLVQHGYPVYGIDHNRQMLAYCQSHVLGPDIRQAYLIQGDMVDLPLQRTFPLIIIPCNTYTILPTQQRLALLHNVSQLLSPGGCFSFSLPNPSMLLEMPDAGDPLPEADFLHPVSGNPVQVSSAWVRSGESITLTWIYDHLHADGTVERITTGATHDILSVEQHQEEFHQAGLEIQEIFGDFDRNAYNKDSLYLIINLQSFPVGGR